MDHTSFDFSLACVCRLLLTEDNKRSEGVNCGDVAICATSSVVRATQSLSYEVSDHVLVLFEIVRIRDRDSCSSRVWVCSVSLEVGASCTDIPSELVGDGLSLFAHQALLQVEEGCWSWFQLFWSMLDCKAHEGGHC